jgi:hypothetical protein
MFENLCDRQFSNLCRFLNEKDHWAYQVFRNKVELAKKNAGLPPSSPPIPTVVPKTEEPEAKKLKIDGIVIPDPVTVTRTDPKLVAYAMRVFGSTDLTEDQWNQCEDQMKVSV